MSAEEVPRHLVLMKEIATVVFFAIFVGVCVWLLLVRRETAEAHARIPLDDGEPPADPGDRRPPAEDPSSVSRTR